jgi:hypothetical protein
VGPVWGVGLHHQVRGRLQIIHVLEDLGQLHLVDGDREAGGVQALLHQFGQATVDA